MRKRSARWWMILSCWSCAACMAWAQSVDGPCAPATPQCAEGCEPEGLPCGSVPSSGARPPKTRVGAWWQYCIKPSLQYSHWGYPEEFEEIPFGARVCAAQRAQICSGWAARLWLYRYDFCDDGAGLNAAGHKRLTELAGEFPVWSRHALVIESTPGNPQLDTARREHVAKLLEGAEVPAQVVIGVPTISAPFGDETREWNTLFMKQVRSGGGQQGGSSAGAMSGTAGGQPSAQ